MRHLLLVTCSILALTAFGCVSEPELRPANTAERAQDAGAGAGAVATESGIQVEARVDAWRWTPEDLDDELTPVLVRIENSSDRPLRVRFEEFQLATPDGRAYAALPPFDIHGEVTEDIGSYAYAAPGFSVAPHLHRYYAGFGPYGSPFYYDDYYGRYYPVYAEYDLPTGDMLIRALPEGVIEPDGRITGFIYFEDLESLEPTPDQVTFRYELVEAGTDERFGVIEIPFEVVED